MHQCEIKKKQTVRIPFQFSAYLMRTLVDKSTRTSNALDKF